MTACLPQVGSNLIDSLNMSILDANVLRTGQIAAPFGARNDKISICLFLLSRLPIFSVRLDLPAAPIVLINNPDIFQNKLCLGTKSA